MALLSNLPSRSPSVTYRSVGLHTRQSEISRNGLEGPQDLHGSLFRSTTGPPPLPKSAVSRRTASRDPSILLAPYTNDFVRKLVRIRKRSGHPPSQTPLSRDGVSRPLHTSRFSPNFNVPNIERTVWLPSVQEHARGLAIVDTAGGTDHRAQSYVVDAESAFRFCPMQSRTQSRRLK